VKLQPPSAKDRQSVLLQWLRHGAELHNQGQLAAAEDYYNAILKAQPNNAEAKHLLGIMRLQQGRFEEAFKRLKQVVAANPGSANAHADMGNAAAKLGRPQEALACYDRAVAINANNAGVLSNRAAVLLDLGLSERALASADAALALEPGNPFAHYNRGNALKSLKRPLDAIESYDRAIATKPDYAEAHNNRGIVLSDLKRHAEAVASYDRAIAVDATFAEAHNNLGIALVALKRLEDGLASYDRALALKPDYAEAFNNRGIVLRDLDRPQEALDSLDRALSLRPAYPEALHNAANCLRQLLRPLEALRTFDRALALKPDYAEAIANRGIVLHELGRHDEALAALDRALTLEPGDPDARFSRSLIALTLGDYASGWADYEGRIDMAEAGPHPFVAGCPRLTDIRCGDGTLRGKRILVWGEQGLGDILQFSRYLPMLVAEGADVTFAVTPKLHRLLQSLGPAIRLVDRPPAEPFDFQSPLMSLPRAFGTGGDSIPAAIPYLTADPDRIADWRPRLGSAHRKLGVFWQGNPAGKADLGRSPPLAAFAPLAAIPDVALISLQKFHGLDQLAALPASMQVATPGPDVDAGADAFVDTAAIMASLDLIVTSDSSVAHLAGALGRPVWLALKSVPDWRWLLDRQDCPWYPTMRLYRQRTPGDWNDVFARMAADLAAIVPRA